MELIQNAYQGFSKANYTMLDNLKLGYGGTKEEMERLVADAAKLDKSIDANSLSFGNVVKAIHAVQTEMGITGTTANEAATTISGSVSTMKAAWSDFLTSLAEENADYEWQLDNLLESVKTVAKNVFPVVEQVLWSINDMVSDVIPEIIAKIPETISKFLPDLMISAAHIITSIVSGLGSALPDLQKAAVEILDAILQIFSDNFPELIVSGTVLIEKLLLGITENIDKVIETIISVIETITYSLTDPWALSKILNAALRLLVQLALGLTEAIPQLVDAVLTVIESLCAFLLDPENLAKIINAALKIIIALGGGFIAAIPRILASLGMVIKKLIESFEETDWGEVGEDIIDGLLDGLKKAWESIKTWFTNAWDNLFGDKSVDVSANVSGGDVDGSHAGGLDYVPFDGYVAELHRGEQVLTAEEARDYKRGGKVVNVVQNIYSTAKTAADLMQEARYQQEKGLIFGV